MSILYNNLEVRIRLAAIRANYRLLCSHGSRVIGVIKADAYGHGLCEVAQALAQEGCDTFAIGSLEEGAALRRFLNGAGINAKAGSIARPATAKDIVPTLAYITDLPITTECCGAILYQALKSPNLKLDEIAKLKEALIRMEGALARDNREPWDKHDCA